MIPVVAPRFDLFECNSNREREFVEALHARAEAGDWHADWWTHNDRIILSVCVIDADPPYNCLLRTLRVDFDGWEVRFGPDETHEFATDLDPSKPGVSALSGTAVSELACAAADWLEREMKRRIDRHEWDRPGLCRRVWVLADSGESLSFSDSSNIRNRPDMGPPDRVVYGAASVEVPNP